MRPDTIQRRAGGTCFARHVAPKLGVARGGRAMGLIEVIGILAMLTILACLVLPRVKNVIKQSQGGLGGRALSSASVDQVAVNVETVRNAVAQHRSKFHSLASRNGQPLQVRARYDEFDRVLISEGYLERPFDARIGSGATIRLINISSLSATTPVDGANGAYDLNGQGWNGLAGASHVIEAVLSEVSAGDAKALNDRLDGPALGAGPGRSDLRGRVVYTLAASGQTCEVHIYIAHQ